MANIKQYVDKIRSAIYGKEVRSSLADGIEAINKEVENTTRDFNDLRTEAGNAIGDLNISISEAKENITDLNNQNIIADTNISNLNEVNKIAATNIRSLDAQNITATANIRDLNIENTASVLNKELLNTENLEAQLHLEELPNKNVEAAQLKNELDEWIEDNKEIVEINDKILNLEEFKEDANSKIDKTMERVSINTEALNNRLKLYSRPHYIEGGVVGIVDLGSSLTSGNYILSITLNANNSGSENYYSSLLYSLQLVVGWQDNRTVNKIYLNSLGYTDAGGLDNVMAHDRCYAVFATTGGNTKPYGQSSSIHIHIPPYTSLGHITFKNASLYMLDI